MLAELCDERDARNEIADEDMVSAVVEVMKHYPFSPVVQRKALSWLAGVAAKDYTREGCCGEETVRAVISAMRNCMFDREVADSGCLFLANCSDEAAVVDVANKEKAGLLVLEINAKNGSAKTAAAVTELKKVLVMKEKTRHHHHHHHGEGEDGAKRHHHRHHRHHGEKRDEEAGATGATEGADAVEEGKAKHRHRSHRAKKEGEKKEGEMTAEGEEAKRRHHSHRHRSHRAEKEEAAPEGEEVAHRHHSHRHRSRRGAKEGEEGEVKRRHHSHRSAKGDSGSKRRHHSHRHSSKKEEVPVKKEEVPVKKEAIADSEGDEFDF